MQQLTNEEWARVFAMYWGNKLNAGMITKVDAYWMRKIQDCETDTVLELTPLSKISDEDAIALEFVSADHFNRSLHSYGEEQFYKNFIRYAEYSYLLLKGYAVPLWFGVGHWANGKTALELNLAIEKTN